MGTLAEDLHQDTHTDGEDGKRDEDLQQGKTTLTCQYVFHVMEKCGPFPSASERRPEVLWMRGPV